MSNGIHTWKLHKTNHNSEFLSKTFEASSLTDALAKARSVHGILIRHSIDDRCTLQVHPQSLGITMHAQHKVPNSFHEAAREIDLKLNGLFVSKLHEMI